jgi:hypothetical protein
LKKNKKIFASAALALGLALFSGQAFAATSVNTVANQGVNGGTRDVSATATAQFSPVSLDGTTKVSTANPGSLTLQDNTGSGAGWHVSAQATQFSEKAPAGGFASGTTAKTLPTGSLTVANTGSSITQNGTTSPSPTWKSTLFTLDNGTPVNIISANANQGMGNYTVAFGTSALALTLVPASTYTDSTNYPSGATPYESTITYTITTGP